MPTLKQKAAIKKISENHGNLSKTMLEVGYSPNTAKKPQNLTESKGWKELFEEYFPDELLNTKLHEGLGANKQLAARVVFKKDAPTSQSAHELPPASSTTDDFIEVPDFAVRHKYLETAYKIKGRYTNNVDITSAGEKVEPTTIIIVEDKQTDE